MPDEGMYLLSRLVLLRIAAPHEVRRPTGGTDRRTASYDRPGGEGDLLACDFGQRALGVRPVQLRPTTRRRGPDLIGIERRVLATSRCHSIPFVALATDRRWRRSSQADSNQRRMQRGRASTAAGSTRGRTALPRASRSARRNAATSRGLPSASVPQGGRTVVPRFEASAWARQEDRTDAAEA